MKSWAEPLARADFVAHNDAEKLNVNRIKACRSGSYRWVLIVPAFDEPANFATEIVQNIALEQDSLGVLLISVINAPDDATEGQRRRTLDMLPQAPSRHQQTSAPEATNVPASDQIEQIEQIERPRQIAPGIYQLTIDAVSHALPAKQSTGLARKLGNDIACELLSAGHIKTPLLCNTDADAVLPHDYFTRLSRACAAHSTSSLPSTAWVLPFTHQSNNPEVQEAGIAYELYLRALQLNMQNSGSPYAYPSLGSVLAIAPIHYAKSRGFPKRRAGEDFYLLNKLAKLGQVHYLTGTPVILAARLSHRVPFGTGPAIKKIIENESAPTDKAVSVSAPAPAPAPAPVPVPVPVPTYALASFALLRQFYSGFAELKAAERSPAGRNLPVAWRDPDLLWLLKKLGLPGALTRLQKNYRSDQTLQRAMHEWFDALKTVRFLNEARHFHPDESLHTQFENLSRFLPAAPAMEKAQKHPGSAKISATSSASEPTNATELNRALERARTESRHSVMLCIVLGSS